MQTIAPILVRFPEAARRLGISRDTVKRLVEQGVLEEVRLTPTSHPRLRLEDVLALAGEQKDATSSARAGQYALVADPDLARALDAENEEVA